MVSSLIDWDWRIWGFSTILLLALLVFGLFFIEPILSIELFQGKATIYKIAIFSDAIFSLIVAILTVLSYMTQSQSGDTVGGEGGSNNGGGGGGAQGGGGGGGSAQANNFIIETVQVVPEGAVMNQEELEDTLGDTIPDAVDQAESSRGEEQ